MNVRIPGTMPKVSGIFSKDRPSGVHSAEQEDEEAHRVWASPYLAWEVTGTILRLFSRGEKQGARGQEPQLGREGDTGEDRTLLTLGYHVVSNHRDLGRRTLTARSPRRVRANTFRQVTAPGPGQSPQGGAGAAPAPGRWMGATAPWSRRPGASWCSVTALTGPHGSF